MSGRRVVMAKIYVSSTVADLELERRVVMEWLVAAGHQPAHSYLPDSDTVQDSCLDDVDTCDLYVLILGHRYGFQPERDNPEGLSITHLEFRRAGQSGIPRIALLRTSIPDVSLSDWGDPRRLALVEAFRAEVAREVRPAEFSDPKGLVQGLSTGVQAELDKLGNRLPAGWAADPVLRLAPRSAFLAGREELLAELAARLAGDADAGPRVVALTGLGGAGKTSVALEYAYRQLGKVGLAWQFRADDTAVLEAEFGELAAQLGVRELLEVRDPVASAHGALAAYPAEWLLILDNVADRAAVERFLPPAGRGRVLVTSRSALWPPGQALEVPVLDVEVAADYLVRLTRDTDRRVALELAGELGGLPLALEQAASYVQAAMSSLARYLVLLRQRRPDLLARGEPARAGETVATTWSLAFAQLERSAPSAVGLLRLLACYAPEAIPFRLLLQPRPGLAGDLGGEAAAVLMPLLEDELAVDYAMSALRRYSLLTPAGDGLVSVHRLVQAVTADQMPADLAAQWRQAAAALIEAAIPADTQRPAAWPVCAMLLPHARVALNLTSGGLWRIARYLGHSGSYPAARDLFQLIASAYEEDDAYGPEHQETLAARSNLAYWTGEAGDAAAARDQLAVLLPVFVRVLGSEHPDTLTTRHNLARWTGKAGDEAGARGQFAALLPIEKRVLGPEHPNTLATQANLAFYTAEAGDEAGARDQLAALLPIQQSVLGREHPNTLTTRHILAGATGTTGDAAAARDQLAALLPVRERVLGPEHRDTLDTRGALAYWTGQAGDAAGARDQFAALLPIQEKLLGPEYPLTLETHGNLARYTGQAGDAAAAREKLAFLLPMFERVWGSDHRATLDTRADLARYTGQAGDAAAARDQLAALLPIQERVRGPEHPDTLDTRRNLAHWTKKALGGPAAEMD